MGVGMGRDLFVCRCDSISDSEIPMFYDKVCYADATQKMPLEK